MAVSRAQIGRRSSQKGGDQERRTARFFSSLFTDNGDTIFWRSGGSGSIFTRGKSGDELAGDITICSAKYPDAAKWFSQVVVEVKNRKTVSLDYRFFLGSGDLHAAWVKVSGEARKTGRRPILTWREYRKGVVFALATDKTPWPGANSISRVGKLWLFKIDL